MPGAVSRGVHLKNDSPVAGSPPATQVPALSSSELAGEIIWVAQAAETPLDKGALRRFGLLKGYRSRNSIQYRMLGMRWACSSAG
jgi:hypothetical protein